MKRLLWAVLVLSAGAVSAQEVNVGTGAKLRGLDKIGGHSVDIDLLNGGSAQLGRLHIRLGECRYPAGNPSGDAYAYLTIHEEGKPELDFSGWMIASSPALSALDHPRYDVWVTRCITS